MSNVKTVNNLENIMQNVKVLKITRTKEIIFVAVFTAMAVYMPMLVHYFAGVDGGREFLSMPFFVLLAGLLLGSRAGLVTAFASASISFLLTGMPKVELLPIVTLQLAAYGFIAGLLKEKYSSLISVAGAIIFGLILTGIAVFFFSKINAVDYAASFIRDGWIGILIQIALIPFIIKIVKVEPLREEL